MSRRAKALLIGIEKYDHLDSDKQLRAGRNDVLAFWKVCRRLGFAPENIHVLTSPRPELEDFIWAEQELGAELAEYVGKSDADIEEIVKKWFPLGDRSRIFVAEATRANIVGENGLVWLAKPVAQPGEPPVDRLLTYSGHGTTIEENGQTTLALCPSDSEQGKAGTYISITDFKKELKYVDENMTVVLDCCFAQSAQKRGGAHRVATLAPAGVEQPLALGTQDIQPRVFCASGANESSHQAMLGGYWYSAFTWALTVVLEQWQINRENKPHSTITHDELLERTRKLLEALSFQQTPVLVGNAMGNKPVFGHLGANEGTSEGPDGERRGGQIDPSGKSGNAFFVEYEFSVDGNEIARVVATSSKYVRDHNNMAPNTEYWRITGDSLNTTTGDLHSKHIYVKKVKEGRLQSDRASFSGNEGSFTCGVDATWTANSTSHKYHESYMSGFRIDVKKDANGAWSGFMHFFGDTAQHMFKNMDVGSSTWYQVREKTPAKECIVRL